MLDGSEYSGIRDTACIHIYIPPACVKYQEVEGIGLYPLMKRECLSGRLKRLLLKGADTSSNSHGPRAKQRNRFGLEPMTI